jgi:hypothetical protein
MKKFVFAILLVLVAGVVFANPDLAAVANLLSSAKEYTDRAETGNTGPLTLANCVIIASNNINELKGLLDRDEYPNEAEIRRQIADLEERLLALALR